MYLLNAPDRRPAATPHRLKWCESESSHSTNRSLLWNNRVSKVERTPSKSFMAGNVPLMFYVALPWARQGLHNVDIYAPAHSLWLHLTISKEFSETVYAFISFLFLKSACDCDHISHHIFNKCSGFSQDCVTLVMTFETTVQPKSGANDRCCM